MHRTTLEKVNTAQQHKNPVVLLSNLQSGEQALYYPDGTTHGFVLSDTLYALANKALRSNRCQLFKEADYEIFLQAFNPPLRMIIIGAVHIAKTLASLARLCHYQVTIVDPRQAFADEARFPDVDVNSDWPDKALASLQPDSRTAIITLTHDPKLDEPALISALASTAFYIGALGSNKTQQARKNRLAENGCSAEQQARIHGPIGLDIGAQSPAEIAVAIMAQVTESLHKTLD
ncbi:MAG: XdhC family protein [Gammaproteobacteria bacterium]|nr:XdhC family protein [Gammaproteobacteria bacterium]